MSAPRHVLDAVGAIVVYGLGQGFDSDGGWFLETDAMSLGKKPDDTPLGSWRIEIRRTAKPAALNEQPRTSESNHE